jgi:hypothetical protein
MATSLVIEEEQGTSRGHIHPHNGYYAGDFSRALLRNPSPLVPLGAGNACRAASHASGQAPNSRYSPVAV